MVQPPPGAPAAVAQMIAAGNAIATLPYIWGGGHGSFISPGYDCSGSVSYVLAAAGLLSSPEISGEFESYGDPGPGQWVTIYANAGHVWMTIAGWRFDTVALAEDGTRWSQGGGEYGGLRRPPPAWPVVAGSRPTLRIAAWLGSCECCTSFVLRHIERLRPRAAPDRDRQGDHGHRDQLDQSRAERGRGADDRQRDHAQHGPLEASVAEPALGQRQPDQIQRRSADADRRKAGAHVACGCLDHLMDRHRDHDHGADHRRVRIQVGGAGEPAGLLPCPLDRAGPRLGVV